MKQSGTGSSTAQPQPQEQRWALAGMEHREGTLDRPAAAGSLMVPPELSLGVVKRHGKCLLWNLGQDGNWATMNRNTTTESSMFENFVKLGKGVAPAEEILSYAKRWGVLGICEHGMPSSHNPPPTPRQPAVSGYIHDVVYGCVPVVAPDHLVSATSRWSSEHTWCRPPYSKHHRRFYEPVEPWRHYARQARALLNIAACLYGIPKTVGQGVEARTVYERTVGRPEDWQTVYEWKTVKTPWWSQEELGIGYEILLVQKIVNEWLTLGNIHPQFYWSGGEHLTVEDVLAKPRLNLPQGAATITFVGGGLFGALALQLVLALSRTDGFAICHSCGGAYIPTRRPRSIRHYCSRCGHKAAVRDAVWRHRHQSSQHSKRKSR